MVGLLKDRIGLGRKQYKCQTRGLWQNVDEGQNFIPSFQHSENVPALSNAR